jgi:hypothetical protein
MIVDADNQRLVDVYVRNSFRPSILDVKVSTVRKSMQH